MIIGRYNFSQCSVEGRVRQVSSKALIEDIATTMKDDKRRAVLFHRQAKGFLTTYSF